MRCSTSSTRACAAANRWPRVERRVSHLQSMTTVAQQRSVSRNDPCPCGSGRRFKDCHGSLRDGTGVATSLAQPPAATTTRTSRYRPAGNDWIDIGDDGADRLGAMMELALKHQVGQRVRNAERLYRAVLEEAPKTHDALHMLGVVRLGLGDYADAERLLRAAMALRAPYPAIEQNWSLVCRSIAARDRRGIEVICEHALPLLQRTLQHAHRAGNAGAGATTERVHVVGARSGVVGDRAWVADRLADLLAPLAPTRWHPPADVRESAAWTRFDRHALDAATKRRPVDGAVIVADVECDTDEWLRDPTDRVLVFAQSALPSTYFERLRRIAADGNRSIALMFSSRAKAQKFGCDAIVVPPPIDLAEFAERADAKQAAAVDVVRVVAVGQDRRRVVVAEDVELLKALATHAGELTVFDPGPLRYDVGMLPRVRCVSRSTRPLAEVLASADLYLHRRLPWWTEDEGRALFGAMASGVPVMCARESVYAEYIDDGVDGWLYDTDDSVMAMLDRLRADRTRLRDAGANARRKALRLFDAPTLSATYVDAVTQWLRQ